MNVMKHTPEPVPPPTYTLEVTEHEADLIRLALDLAGSTAHPPASTPTDDQVVELDGLYVNINRPLGFRDESLRRLGFPVPRITDPE